MITGFNVVVSFYLTLIAVTAESTQCFSTEYKPFTARNFAFTGWQYKTIVKCSFQKCLQACKSERACISMNFDDSSGKGIGCCALNGCGVEDEENKGSSLVFTPGCLYRQVRPTEAAIVKGGKYGKCIVKKKLQACLSGWTRYRGSCYMLIKSGRKWDNAKIYCERRDSHLVEIDSLDENKFIVQLVKTSASRIPARIWIGIRFFSPGIYKWTDKTVANFTRWNNGEPNNADKAPCGQMYIQGKSAGYWNDFYCSKFAYYFVCERAAQ